MRRDNRGAGGGAVVAGLLLIVGAVLFLVIGGSSAHDGGQILFIGFLVLGALVAGVVVLAYRGPGKGVAVGTGVGQGGPPSSLGGPRPSGAAKVVVGVLGGLAAGASLVFLIGVLMCLSIFAAFAAACQSITHAH